MYQKTCFFYHVTVGDRMRNWDTKPVNSKRGSLRLQLGIKNQLNNTKKTRYRTSLTMILKYHDDNHYNKVLISTSVCIPSID